MKTPTPEISVITPVFNGELFLSEAIESILAQSFREFEFIIIDDGSTDDTPGILEAYAKQDDRIRIYSQKNTGIVKALNRAINKARAPFIARMDADDLSWPNRFKVQIEFLRENPDLVALGSAVRIVNETGVGERIISHPKRLATLADAIQANRLLAHPTAMLRRDAVLEVGGYREAFQGVEDTDLWLRIVGEGPIGNVSETLLDYREHRHKVTNISSHLNRIKEFVVRGQAYQRLKGLPERALPKDWQTDLTLEFAEAAIGLQNTDRNPWMPDKKVRRVLRDVLLTDPGAASRCRSLLRRMARCQAKELRLAGSLKSLLYGI